MHCKVHSIKRQLRIRVFNQEKDLMFHVIMSILVLLRIKIKKIKTE
jgi:hypothetical protein